MTQKNTTAIERGAMLAKQQMNQAKTGKPSTLAIMLNGNRAQRRAAEKQMRKGVK